MKKKIALFANGWNSENLDLFIKGIRTELDEENYDLFIFTSHAAYSLSEKAREAENSIYFLPDYSTFDGAIIYGSGMNSGSALKNIIKNCNAANVPCVIQGDKIEGETSITVNNYAGMKELCIHLIDEHKVKKILFIAGPRDNDDSNMRINALKDVMDEKGLDFSQVEILYANWERTAVHTYILENFEAKHTPLPDAIICANDPMALFCLMSLEGLGINSPQDVLVTGFDNINDGRLFFPSIASVDQRYTDQGSECAKALYEKMSGAKDVQSIVIPCIAVPGESCGCVNCKNEAEVRKMLGHDALYKRFKDESLRGRESHLEMCIVSSENYTKIPDTIKKDMFATKGEEGDDFHIFLNPEYAKLVYYEAPENMEIDCYSASLDVIASKTYGIVNDDESINRNGLFPGYSGNGKSNTFVFVPVRIASHAIGYMVMGYSMGAYENCKYSDFSGRLNKALDMYQMNIKMSHLNERLSELLNKDSLTNVKNRIAYDNYIIKMDDEIARFGNKKISVIMCDINNLKTINDGLGHDAGDIYIKNCCKLMCDSFKCSPIFRIGGDEFVIVISTSDYDVRFEKLEEMRKKMDDIAASNCTPLERVSIATGIADLDVLKDASLANTVKRADAFMYINKAEIKARML